MLGCVTACGIELHAHIAPMSLACALQGRISLLGKLCVNAASVSTAGFILRCKTDKMCGPAWSLLRNM